LRRRRRKKEVCCGVLVIIEITVLFSSDRIIKSMKNKKVEAKKQDI
jgi:hypothetical protein